MPGSFRRIDRRFSMQDDTHRRLRAAEEKRLDMEMQNRVKESVSEHKVCDTDIDRIYIYI